MSSRKYISSIEKNGAKIIIKITTETIESSISFTTGVGYRRNYNNLVKLYTTEEISIDEDLVYEFVKTLNNVRNLND